MKNSRKPIQMLRIVLIGAAESERREINRRLLRAAVVDGIDADDLLQFPHEFDAAAILAPQQVSSQRVEQLLVAQKHVLIAPDRSVTRDQLEGLAKLAHDSPAQLRIMNPERALASSRVVHDCQARG